MLPVLPMRHLFVELKASLAFGEHVRQKHRSFRSMA